MPGIYCKKCRTFKKEKEFWNNSASASGKQVYCISCLKEYSPRSEASKRYESKFTRPTIGGRRVRVPTEKMPRDFDEGDDVSCFGGIVDY